MIRRSLYICYFGVNEPLVQTQVLPYLRELVKGGNELTLLTFERGNVDEDAVRESLADDGIEWHWLRYHKSPSVPATMFDIANAVRFIRKLSKQRPFDILHARSHVPMMAAALTRKLSGSGPRLLFDIRGFLAEEYVDGGVWPADGAIHRSVKRVENWLMREADGFVVLTNKAREYLASEIGERPVEVIPCCIDPVRFAATDLDRQSMRKHFGWEDRFVVVHLGSLGGLYLTDRIVELMGAARDVRSDAFGLFLCHRPPADLASQLREAGFSDSDFLITSAEPSEISRYLVASDVGVSMVKESLSSIARSPTKIPEYLASGLPVISNRGVGDVDELLINNRVGTLLNDKTVADYAEALMQTDGIDRGHCREVAADEFDLAEVGGVRYRRLYERLS